MCTATATSPTTPAPGKNKLLNRAALHVGNIRRCNGLYVCTSINKLAPRWHLHFCEGERMSYSEITSVPVCMAVRHLPLSMGERFWARSLVSRGMSLKGPRRIHLHTLRFSVATSATQLTSTPSSRPSHRSVLSLLGSIICIFGLVPPFT